MQSQPLLIQPWLINCIVCSNISDLHFVLLLHSPRLKCPIFIKTKVWKWTGHAVLLTSKTQSSVHSVSRLACAFVCPWHQFCTRFVVNQALRLQVSYCMTYEDCHGDTPVVNCSEAHIQVLSNLLTVLYCQSTHLLTRNPCSLHFIHTCEATYSKGGG